MLFSRIFASVIVVTRGLQQAEATADDPGADDLIAVAHGLQEGSPIVFIDGELFVINSLWEELYTKLPLHLASLLPPGTFGGWKVVQILLGERSIECNSSDAEG